MREDWIVGWWGSWGIAFGRCCRQGIGVGIHLLADISRRQRRALRSSGDTPTPILQLQYPNSNTPPASSLPHIREGEGWLQGSCELWNAANKRADGI